MTGFHAFRLGGLQAPARDAVPIARQTQRHPAAHLAHAQNGHADVLGTRLHDSLPTALKLRGRTLEVAAVHTEHGPQRGLGHGRVHRRINHARQRNVSGQRRVAQQGLDPRPQRLNEAQIGQVLQRTLRRIGHYGDINEVVFRGLPRGHKTLSGKCCLQQFKPLGLRVCTQARGEQDRHGELAALSTLVNALASV